MYKQYQNAKLDPLKKTPFGLKKKLLTILTAIMIGLANGMDDKFQEKYTNQYTIEQQDKKD